MIRSALVAVGLVAFSLRPLALPAEGQAVSVQEVELLKWAATQGGLLVASLLLAWSYRRDFLGTMRRQERTLEEADHAIEAMRALLSAHTEVARTQTHALEELRAVIEHCRALQRMSIRHES